MESEVPIIRSRDGRFLPAEGRQDKAERKTTGGGSSSQGESTSVENTRMGEQCPFENGANLTERSNCLKRKGEPVVGEKEGRVSREAINLLIKRQNQGVRKPYSQC